MASRNPEFAEGGRLPPQALEAERSVLGAMLLEREAIARAIEVLDESSFYREAHRKIFRAILQLFERNEAADLVTLSEELKRTGQLEAVGGIPYLTTLFEYVATSANIEYHSKIVLEKAIMRKLIEVSAQIAAQAYDSRGDAGELIDLAEQEIFAIQDPRLKRGFVPIRNLLAHSIEVIQELHDNKRHVTGVPSGFRDLDELTAGFQKSDLVIVAGRPSMGKTSFCLNIAEYAAIRAETVLPVAFFSLEMSKEQLVQRLLCSQARIPGHKVRRGFMRDEEWSRLTAAAGKLFDAPIYIDDTPSLGVLEMRAKARRLKAEVPLGLIIVDYVQLIRGAPGVENRQQEISQISRALKALAKELEVPVIALSQLSRAVETRGGDKRPVLSDLRECVPGDTLVCLADGRRVPVAELVGTEPEVLAMSEGERIVTARSDKVWRVGVRPVFRVELASGREFRATSGHRVYGARGWMPLEDLRAGDRLGIARSIPEPEGAARWSDARSAMSRRGITTRAMASLRGTSYGGAAHFLFAPSRDLVLSYAELLEDEALKARAESDLFWDSVVAVTPDGQEEVYDLTVPGPASWLADGIVSHNSGALEQDADVVIFIYREAMYERTTENENIAEILVRKQRNGPTGDLKLQFSSELTLFQDLARYHIGEEAVTTPEPFDESF